MTNHLLITGTGRAGTSFLVEFLDACGLDCGDLSTSYYFEGANAGYEHNPTARNLPYVVKNPLLHQYLQSTAVAAMTVDGVIIPVRDLRAAASSRILQQRAAAAWVSDDSSAMTEISTTPGGAIISLSIEDQERLLAVGQTRIIQWAVHQDLPIYLLDFPRIVDDAGYCVDRLWPILHTHCSRDEALVAHSRVAKSDRVTIRHVRSTDDPVELHLRIASLEKAIADLHAEGAGPMTSLRALLVLEGRTLELEERTSKILKVLRGIAKHLGRTDDSTS